MLLYDVHLCLLVSYVCIGFLHVFDVHMFMYDFQNGSAGAQIGGIDKKTCH